VNSKEENSSFVPITSKNSASVLVLCISSANSEHICTAGVAASINLIFSANIRCFFYIFSCSRLYIFSGGRTPSAGENIHISCYIRRKTRILCSAIGVYDWRLHLSYY
jgi:hypothetical protein